MKWNEMRLQACRTATFSLLAITLTTSVGCKSAADQANDQAVAQARLQAAQTGQPQQVTWVDKDGNRTLVVVQPPVAGQAAQQVTTTVTRVNASAGTTSQTTTTSMQPLPAATAPLPGPVVTPANGQPGGSASITQGSAFQGAPGMSQPNSASSNTQTGPVVSAVNAEIPAGTTLAIRLNQTINVKTWRAGDHFSGSFARPLLQNGHEIIPSGTPVEGRVDASHRRGHFKGRSILELRLISMNLNGARYRLDTKDSVRTKKGKGKRSAAFIGGGAGLGMLVGGIASGGVGLLAGGLAGGGAGTLIGGLTGNRDIVLPAESVVDFRLADDLIVQPM